MKNHCQRIASMILNRPISYLLLMLVLPFLGFGQEPAPDSTRQTEDVYFLENLGPSINSEYNEVAPVISPDGRSLYLSRNHPQNIAGGNFSDIWYSTLNEDDQWTFLRQAPTPLNNDADNFLISITPDGNTMLLGNTYTYQGRTHGQGISISYKRNGQWQLPMEQHITNFVNWNRQANYFLSADGQHLLLAIEDGRSKGGLDLYVSFRQPDGAWGQAQHLGDQINSPYNDFSPFLAADGKTLYFASYGHKSTGYSDIYMSKRLDKTWKNWSAPENLGPRVNTSGWEAYFSVPAQGEYAYLVSNNPEITYGNLDVFRVQVDEKTRPDPVMLIEGRAFNKKTEEPIEAEIVYENLETGEVEGKAFATVEEGYKIALPQGFGYGYRAEAPGFYPIAESVDLDSLEQSEEKTVNLYLVPIEELQEGATVRLNNVFFHTNEATLKEESFPELERLVEFLAGDTTMHIEIGGHADAKGSDGHNQTLSTKRAEAVYHYLLEQGISEERLSYKGYGEMRPIGPNDTEEGRELNRRVEFTILEIGD